MKYIQDNIGLPLILSINKSGNIKWYVNVEFAVNTDMSSYTVGFTTIGKGEAYSQSSLNNLIPRVQLIPSL